MDELRVPTRRLPAEVVCVGGTRLVGSVFLSEVSRHAGAMRPHEWANEGDPFFPFLLDDERRPVMVGKETVLAISLQEALEETPAPVVERRVTIECPGLVLEGSLRMEMPSGQQRVLDYLNRDESFVALFADGREHLVHKRYILRVMETGTD